MFYPLARLRVVLLALVLSACARAIPTPQPASVTVQFDLAGGGSGFSLVIYAQDVDSGESISQTYSSSSHGQVVLPTSAPLVFSLPAPATYIFYANMLNAPDEYHFGATGCPPGPDCASTVYQALDVSPGDEYTVYFSDRSGERHAPVPTPHAPVTVPWNR
jgi:hypothetical protein